MITLSRDQLSSSAKSSVDIETDTEYLQLAKKGGGHKGNPYKILTQVTMLMKFGVWSGILKVIFCF